MEFGFVGTREPFPYKIEIYIYIAQFRITGIKLHVQVHTLIYGLGQFIENLQLQRQFVRKF